MSCATPHFFLFCLWNGCSDLLERAQNTWKPNITSGGSRLLHRTVHIIMPSEWPKSPDKGNLTNTKQWPFQSNTVQTTDAPVSGNIGVTEGSGWSFLVLVQMRPFYIWTLDNNERIRLFSHVAHNMGWPTSDKFSLLEILVYVTKLRR